MRINTGEKPYPWNQCTIAFSQDGDLKKSLKLHTGKNPYPCNQCTMAFYQDIDLKKHLGTDPGKKLFFWKLHVLYLKEILLH